MDRTFDRFVVLKDGEILATFYDESRADRYAGFLATEDQGSSVTIKTIQNEQSVQKEYVQKGGHQ